MRIYSRTGNGNGTVLVQPGVEHPEVAEFMTAASREAPPWICGGPAVVRVQFTNGAAEVSRELGRFMIRRGLAGRWFWSAA